MRQTTLPFMESYDIMEEHFINGGIATFLYAIFKFIDVRFVSKSDVSVRVMTRDILLVYVSSVAGFYVANNMNNTAIKKTTAAFVGKPTF